MQARIIERLTRADVVRIEAPGTDLTLPLMSEVYGNTDTLVVPATTAHDGADLAGDSADAPWARAGPA